MIYSRKDLNKKSFKQNKLKFHNTLYLLTNKGTKHMKQYKKHNTQ